MKSSKEHWERIYSTKKPYELSWTEVIPKTSLEFIHGFNLPRNSAIIDIGGGESRLADYLIEEGYENVSVLDISEIALNKAKERLGKNAYKINWIVCDILEFKPRTKYNLWHDRATFHFLTTKEQIKKYLLVAKKSVINYLTVSTFSDKGPEKCSGLDVCRYNENELQNELHDGFEKIKCITENHITPFNTAQNFLYCSFKRV